MISKNELLFTVDEENNPIEPLQRQEVHKKGIWHRTAHVWVQTLDKKIVAHQRSNFVDTNPSEWQAFFGGHLQPNMSYIDAAFTELEEESGLKVQKKNLLHLLTYKSNVVKEFMGIFLYRWNGNLEDLQVEEEEVMNIQLFSLDRLKTLYQTGKPKNWTFTGYELGMIQKLMILLP